MSIEEGLSGVLMKRLCGSECDGWSSTAVDVSHIHSSIVSEGQSYVHFKLYVLLEGHQVCLYWASGVLNADIAQKGR